MTVELHPGTLLNGGRYNIVKTLGHGGFGITYLAEQTSLGRRVCIKEFFPMDYFVRDNDTQNAKVVSERFGADMELYRAKFRKEAKTIAALSHNNIVSIIDVFDDNNTTYYAMDYIDGFSLRELIDRQGAITEAQAIGYIRQAARALDYIHQSGRVHLDIKPGNIMVRRSDDSVVVIDFGLSKHFNEDGTPTSTTPGGLSRGYTPLEMYQTQQERKFLPATDIYSLGATLYTLLTGEVLPEVTEVAIMGGIQVPTTVPTKYANAIRKAMGLTPKARPDSIASFMAMFNDVVTADQVDIIDTIPENIPVVPVKPQVVKREKGAESKEEGRKFDTERQEYNHGEVCRAVRSHINEVLKRGILSGKNRSRRVITTIYVNNTEAFTLTSQYSQIGQLSVHSGCPAVSRAISDLYLEDKAVLRPGDKRIFGENTQAIIDHIYDIVADIAAPITYETKIKYTKYNIFRLNLLAIVVAIGICFAASIVAHFYSESRGYDSHGVWTVFIDWDSYYLIVHSAVAIVAVIYLLFLTSTLIGKSVGGNRK